MLLGFEGISVDFVIGILSILDQQCRVVINDGTHPVALEKTQLRDRFVKSLKRLDELVVDFVVHDGSWLSFGHNLRVHKKIDDPLH